MVLLFDDLANENCKKAMILSVKTFGNETSALQEL